MKNTSSKGIANWTLPLLFAVIVLLLSGVNFNLFLKQIKDGKIEKNTTESLYKSEFYNREQFINLYGISLNALNKKMLGNFEYVKDDSGVVHLISSASCQQYLGEHCLNNMIELRDYLDRQGSPLVYMQIPAREMKGYSDYPSEAFDETAKTIETLLKGLEDNNIDTINLGEYCLGSPDAMQKEQFFFKTDIHLTTDAEMWAGRHLLEYLNKNTLCNIDPDIFEADNYQKEVYSFRGNLAREGGKYFTEADQFNIYFPNYETSFLMNNSLQEVVKTGAFEDTVMNGYTKANDIDEYVYWVTNYLQFTSPYYSIVNNLQDENNILMIMDSMCFRTASYLSLGCHKVTILDPRYFNGTDYIDVAIKNDDYDAVVVCHQSSLFGYNFFPEQVQKDKLQLLNVVESAATHSLDYCNGAWTQNTNILNVSKALPYIELSGWGADLQAGLPAGEMYVAIGSHILKCSYGIESPSAAAYFNNDNLYNVGFNIKIPTELVIAENTGTLQLWIVSNDGEKVYKTSDYIINMGE